MVKGDVNYCYTRNYTNVLIGAILIKKQKAVSCGTAFPNFIKVSYNLFNAFFTSFTVLGTSGIASAARFGA